MATKNALFKVKNLLAQLNHILGRAPYEYFLIPDKNGFVPVKELIQAFHEDTFWSYVRTGHLNEVFITEGRGQIEIENGRIRHLNRKFFHYTENPSENVPFVLYTPVRRKAHPVVIEKGIIAQSPVLLFNSKNDAERYGRRKDATPVVLSIKASDMIKQGELFWSFGTNFIAEKVDVHYIDGPPASQINTEKLKSSKDKKISLKNKNTAINPYSGGFIMQPESILKQKKQNSFGKKKRSWKEDVRKERRSV